MGWKFFHRVKDYEMARWWLGHCWRDYSQIGITVCCPVPFNLPVRWIKTVWWWVVVPSKLHLELGVLRNVTLVMESRDRLIRDQIIELKAAKICLEVANAELVKVKKTLREERVLLKEYTDYCGKLPRD